MTISALKLAAALAAVFFLSHAFAADIPTPPPADFTSSSDPYELEWRTVAQDVYIGVRPQSARFPVVGTSVIVVGGKSVLVFDGGGAPQQAERVLEKIRKETGKPVSHIVISHWHGDHHLGLSPLRAAFPQAKVVAHSFTKRAIGSALMDYAREAAASEPGALEKRIAMARENAREDADPVTQTYFDQALAHAGLVEEQSRAGEIPAVDIVFEDRLDIDLGGRSVELHHFGPGNTRGDAMLYIPDVRIMAAGDAVVHPTPYGFFSHPRQWAASLGKLKQFDVALLVPGHGEPQADWRYVDLLIETFEHVADETARLVAEGHDLDSVRESFDWSPVEARFTGGDPFWAGRFDVWFKRPILEAAFRLETGEPNEEPSPSAHHHDAAE